MFEKDLFRFCLHLRKHSYYTTNNTIWETYAKTNMFHFNFSKYRGNYRKTFSYIFKLDISVFPSLPFLKLLSNK